MTLYSFIIPLFNRPDELRELLQSLAAQGTAIFFVSSDLPELLGLSHRILVMHGGGITATLDPKETTEEDIMGYASGLGEKAA